MHHRRQRDAGRTSTDHRRPGQGRQGDRYRLRTLYGVPEEQSVTALSLTGLGEIQLWSPSPALYELTATVTVPGTGTHSVRQRIEICEATFRPDGFFLNGQRLKIFGLDRHQLFPYTGMAMPARIQRQDAEIIKNDFNCNMVRCSHYPQSPHFLDVCDELGLMVWEETPGWHHVGSAAWQDIVLANVRDMVIRDRSRPSVIIWGTRLNETSDHPGLYRRTRQIAKDLDGSRPSPGAMDHQSTRSWDEDVFAYNDYGISAAGHYRLRPPLPHVPYLITESVGVELPRPRHYRWTDPPALLAQQAVYHAQAHDIAQSDARYAGLIAWVAFDYAVPQMGQPWGQNVKWAALAHGFRVAKPAAAIYLSQVDPRVRPCGCARVLLGSGGTGQLRRGPAPARCWPATASGWKSSSAIITPGPDGPSWTRNCTPTWLTRRPWWTSPYPGPTVPSSASRATSTTSQSWWCGCPPIRPATASP